MVRKAESLVIVALAVAGLIALGAVPASATHVSCGDTVTTDTTLDSDLVDCPNHGIVIGANDITLDLNGHTVDGDDTPVVGCLYCDLGLFNEGHDGVTVRDGSVSEFTAGVYDYDPVAEDPAHHNRVLGISSREIFVVGNRNVIARNRVSGGAVSVRGNRNVITRNQVRDGGEIVIEGRGHVAARNVVVGARLIGIYLTIGGNNTVRRNLVRGARRFGFWVAQYHHKSLLKRNVAVGAGDDGFAIRTHRATKLTRNRAVRNGDLGINALRGVIDGGGNRAHGNGNPAQCINISCK